MPVLADVPATRQSRFRRGPTLPCVDWVAAPKGEQPSSVPINLLRERNLDMNATGFGGQAPVGGLGTDKQLVVACLRGRKRKRPVYVAVEIGALGRMACPRGTSVCGKQHPRDGRRKILRIPLNRNLLSHATGYCPNQANPPPGACSFCLCLAGAWSMRRQRSPRWAGSPRLLWSGVPAARPVR